ncbi:hypothetical protein LCGC14_2848000, partial [marine sediment metagenome]
RRRVWWDCLDFNPHPTGHGFEVSYYTRLFGNANVGNLNLTNLQIAGQLTSDSTAYLLGWYLSMNKADICTEDLFANAAATLNVGDHPQAQRKLIELQREPQPLGVVLPVRQCFNVNMEFFGKSFNAFKNKLRAADRDPERDPFRIWIHLEGWEIRERY